MGKFDRFLQREGIIHQRSSAYTPEQNGVAERYNRSILEKTRCILNEFTVPKFLWGEALRTAVHIRNLIPKTGHDITPYELMFGKKPSVDHLRVFGCSAHVHIPRDQRKKTDPVSTTGIFVGYAEFSRAWRVLTWSSGKLRIIESASVTFAEHTSPTISELNDALAVPVDTDPFPDEDDDFFYVGLVPIPTAARHDPTTEQHSADCSAENADSTQLEVHEQSAGSQILSEGHKSGVHASDDSHSISSSSSIHDESDPAHEFDPADVGVDIPGQPRYPGRQRKAPDRLTFNVTASTLDDPADGRKGNFDNPTVKEALQRQDKELWVQAINAELRSVFEKQVYEECELPPGRKALTMRIVLKIKRDVYGNVEKYKARLVVRGFLQKEGIDFDEIFAPTAQCASFRMLISIAAQQRLQIEQIDVSTAFLNGELSEEVYVQLPACLPSTSRVWRLRKALYGLKQAAKAWNDKLTAELSILGFQQSMADPCLFFRGCFRERVFILFHVDDAVIVGMPIEVTRAKADIASVFQITDLGQINQFLSIEVIRSNEEIRLTQKEYARSILQKFGMGEGERGKPIPMAPGTVLVKGEDEPLPAENEYCAIVGSLLYLAVNTRPDISYAVGVLSRHMSAPTVKHMQAAKYVLRYLRQTVEFGLSYKCGPRGVCEPYSNGCSSWFYNAKWEHHPDLGVSAPVNWTPNIPQFKAFADADFAGDVESRKSTTGVIIMWGTHPITWFSKMQPIVTTSTTEAEFVAAATATKEGLWVRKLLQDILMGLIPVQLQCDNEAAIALIKNTTAGVSGRTKHIDVQFLFTRERRLRGELTVEFVPSHMQLADILTKPLSRLNFEEARALIGVRGA
jgi:hypothetical protein